MQALRWAARFAPALDADIEAIGAWHFPIGYGVGGASYDWDPQQDITKCLTQCVDDVFGSERPPRLRLLVREGNPAEVLLDESADAFLVVVGSRGHGGFAGMMLG